MTFPKAVFFQGTFPSENIQVSLNHSYGHLTKVSSQVSNISPHQGSFLLTFNLSATPLEIIGTRANYDIFREQNMNLHTHTIKVKTRDVEKL